jgi:hypothetical protein
MVKLTDAQLLNVMTVARLINVHDRDGFLQDVSDRLMPIRGELNDRQVSVACTAALIKINGLPADVNGHAA